MIIKPYFFSIKLLLFTQYAVITKQNLRGQLPNDNICNEIQIPFFKNNLIFYKIFAMFTKYLQIYARIITSALYTLQ